jgi:hypothetical protein
LHKQLEYAVEGDGACLAKGRFGAWVLGRDDISVSVKGVQELILRVHVHKVIWENQFITECLKTVFWGDPRIIDSRGNHAYLSQLTVETENLDPGNGTGIDYYGGPVKIQARLFSHALPSEPEDYSREAVIRVSLKGLDAVQFETSIGGDYPPGQEENLRKWHTVNVRGKSARFISILEPFEKDPMIASAEAENQDTVKVSLADGTVQIININGLEDPQPGISVQFTERQNGIEITETAEG